MHLVEYHKNYPSRGESRWIKTTVTLSHIVDRHCIGIVIFKGLYSDFGFLGLKTIGMN